MGSGLSMTSVNKIKELAMSREYSLALEIIESQDLTKSLNPQFIRLCGDVYVANKRYKDARKVFLMAHRMAPEAKRVIFSLSDLYFRMGYKDLAEFYYKLYMFDAEPDLPQTNQMNYIYSKAQGCPFQEIETLLFPMYSDLMDYDWSFELYLLMKIQGKDAEATAIKNDYVATFKTEQNSEIMEELEKSTERLEDLFYIYPKNAVEDDDPEQEELRQEEKPLLEADDNRINPKEAEIQIVFDDNEKASFGAKLKYKKHLKEQEKLARQAEKSEETEEQDSEAALDDQSSEEETVELEQSQSEVQQNSSNDGSSEKVSIFKKLFSKKKIENVEDIVSEETDNNQVETHESKEHTPDTETDEENQEDVIDILEQPETVQPENDEVGEQGVEDDTIDDVSKVEAQEDEYDFDFQIEECLTEDNVEEETGTDGDDFNTDKVETATEEESEQAIKDDMGDSVMQEIYGKKKISIVTELGEDTFVNVSEIDTNKDASNPFDELLGYEKKNSVIDTDAEVDNKEKTSFVFEEVQLEPEDVGQYEVDDFSQGFKLTDFEEDDLKLDTDSDVDTDFGEMVDATTEENVEETIEEATYGYVEEAIGETTDEFVDDEVTEEAVEDTIEEFANEDKFVEETIEDVIEEAADEFEEGTIEETVEESADGYVEDAIEDALEESANEYEFVEEAIVDTMEEAVEEFEEEAVGEATEEPAYTPQFNVADSLEGESVYDTLKKKGNMDFPEFKTTLFPEYGQQVAEVENNFDEIMSQAQDKINENLLKEEQMQREAEALLASLGIDIGNIKPTINTDNGGGGSVERTQAVLTQQDGMQATESSHMVDELNTEETQEEVTKYRPSRDELKASLKIDSVKKSILKQIKEYR